MTWVAACWCRWRRCSVRTTAAPRSTGVGGSRAGRRATSDGPPGRVGQLSPQQHQKYSAASRTRRDRCRGWRRAGGRPGGKALGTRARAVNGYRRLLYPAPRYQLAGHPGAGHRWATGFSRHRPSGRPLLHPEKRHGHHQLPRRLAAAGGRRVSYPLENAIQQLPSIKKVTSISSAGLSQ